MNTKLLMLCSSIFLGITGLALSFLPAELIQLAGESPNPLFTLVLQIAGAMYLGFAMLNWMAKANLMGGIYSRPVAIGNLAHFLIGGLALLKSVFTSELPFIFGIAALLYGVFALAFAYVMFTHPLRSGKPSYTA